MEVIELEGDDEEDEAPPKLATPAAAAALRFLCLHFDRCDAT